MKLLKNFMFHRATLVTISILAQLIVLIWVILEFNQYFVFFYALSIVASVIVVLWLLTNNTKSVYKVAWIIPILLFPIFGGLFYIFFGLNSNYGRMKRKMALIKTKIIKNIEHDEEIIKDLPKYVQIQTRYIENITHLPPHKNTHVEYYLIGEKTFEHLIEELEKAEKYIFLEYFMIKPGIMWDKILEILISKTKMGVDVRVIYDDWGCLLSLPHRYNHYLEKLGIKCAVFNPIYPILSKRHNTRNHRKIAIIDGEVAFTGGINIGDEYINIHKRFGHWKDTAVMLKGEAVWNFTVMFLSMWNYLRNTDEDFSQFHGNLTINDTSGYVQPYYDNPTDNEPVGEVVYLNLINKAVDYVYITTPYLIIDSEMMISLTSAAKAGVDVRIITPHIADKHYVHAVTRSYYKTLIQSGVKIYEYEPGFIHSKMMVVDGQFGVVGTINMDYRSLYLHFECGVWMYKTDCIQDMVNDFNATFALSKLITMEFVRRTLWIKKLIGAILRIFSPLL